MYKRIDWFYEHWGAFIAFLWPYMVWYEMFHPDARKNADLWRDK